MNKVKETKSRRMIRELGVLADAVETGKPLEGRYTVRTIHRLPPPSKFDAQRVRRTRKAIGVSQAVFADMLGVSTSLVQSWEQGFRHPSRMACRLLDEIDGQRERWRAMLTA
jgi:DNA-binding transcriptional regulator YiaG